MAYEYSVGRPEDDVDVWDMGQGGEIRNIAASPQAGEGYAYTSSQMATNMPGLSESAKQLGMTTPVKFPRPATDLLGYAPPRPSAMQAQPTMPADAGGVPPRPSADDLSQAQLAFLAGSRQGQASSPMETPVQKAARIKQERQQDQKYGEEFAIRMAGEPARVAGTLANERAGAVEAAKTERAKLVQDAMTMRNNATIGSRERIQGAQDLAKFEREELKLAVQSGDADAANKSRESIAKLEAEASMNEIIAQGKKVGSTEWQTAQTAMLNKLAQEGIIDSQEQADLAVQRGLLEVVKSSMDGYYDRNASPQQRRLAMENADAARAELDRMAGGQDQPPASGGATNPAPSAVAPGSQANEKPEVDVNGDGDPDVSKAKVERAKAIVANGWTMDNVSKADPKFQDQIKEALAIMEGLDKVRKQYATDIARQYLTR